MGGDNECGTMLLLECILVFRYRPEVDYMSFLWTKYCLKASRALGAESRVTVATLLMCGVILVYVLCLCLIPLKFFWLVGF